ESAQSVLDALTLLEAGGAGGERDDVGTLRPRGALEAQPGPGALLEEQRGDGEALQGRYLLYRAGEHLGHDVGGVEEPEQVGDGPSSEVDEVSAAIAWCG